jgi:hypothetical protein
MSSASGLSTVHRVQARDRAVNAAMLGLRHAPQMFYTQGPQRWEGIARKLNAKLGEYPKHVDCSAFVTWCLYNGLVISGFTNRDIVNGADWKGGYTGTLLTHGKQVHHLENVQRADYVIYGNGGTGEHTALVVGRRKADGKIMVVSMGSDAGPFYLPYDYRRDIMQVRRAI